MAQYSDRNLIVNYIPQDLSDHDFFDLFAMIGSVKRAKLVRDRSSGFSYGFGFVEYVRCEDAQQAILSYNGLHLQHKTLKVAFARLQGDESKNCNLHLENLPAWLTLQQMTMTLAPHGGIIRSKVLSDESGLSKRQGFVLFETRSAAESALAALHGKPWPGTNEPLITVRFAAENSKKVRPPVYQNGGAIQPGSLLVHPPQRQHVGVGQFGNTFTLYIYNIGKQTTDEELYTLFLQFGSVVEALVLRDRVRGQSKNCGFVTFSNYQSALSAIQMLNGKTYRGKTLQVSFKKKSLQDTPNIVLSSYGVNPMSSVMPSYIYRHLGQSRTGIF